MRTPDGRFFPTGLPFGHPDLSGFRWIDNKTLLVEVKNVIGEPRKDQMRFHHMLTLRGIIHGIARSVGDARIMVEGGLCGYGFDD